MNKKMLFVSLLFFIVSFIASGCWDRQELDRIAFVLTFGVDQDSPEDEYIEMTMLIGRPMAKEESGSTGSGESPYYLVTNKEKAPSTAQAGLMDFTARQMNLHHNLAVIFGRQTAENGLEPFIDRIIRCRECRPETYVFVYNDKAKEFLKEAKPRLEDLPSKALVGLMEDTEGPFFAHPIRVIDFIKDFLAEGKDPFAPLVEIKKDLRETVKNNENGEDNGSENDEENTEEEISDAGEILISGMAVFREDKLVGIIKEEEASGALWIMGKKTGRFITEHSEVGSITISNVSGDSSINADFVAKNRLVIEISTKGNISDWPLLRKDLNRELLESVEKSMEEKIKEEIDKSLKVLQELKSDIFGFGQHISRHHPHDWSELKDDWPEIYKDLEVEVTVSAKIERSGFIR